MFVLPIAAATSFGAMHLISQSFMVYLKYQALVDSYYYNVVMKEGQSEQAAEPTQNQTAAVAQ